LLTLFFTPTFFADNVPRQTRLVFFRIMRVQITGSQ